MVLSGMRAHRVVERVGRTAAQGKGSPRCEAVRTAGETMGAVLGQFRGVLKREAVLAYEVSQFAAFDATSQVVPGGDRQEGTGVVVETRCVGIPGRLCDGAAYRRMPSTESKNHHGGPRSRQG